VIETVLRRFGRPKTELIVEQRLELRGDEIRRLVDEEADSRIAETAVATHLADADVVVPVRDRAVGGVGLEADALEPVYRRRHDRHRLHSGMQLEEVDAIECMVSRIVLAGTPRAEFGLERGKSRGQPGDHTDVEIVIRPAVEPLADAFRERVVDV
jgi:hypothetical protein